MLRRSHRHPVGTVEYAQRPCSRNLGRVNIPPTHAQGSNNAALSQLAAVCSTRNEIGPNYSYVIQVYSCYAYNGFAEARRQVYPPTSQPPINQAAVANQATMFTSRAVSIEVLPTLQF